MRASAVSIRASRAYIKALNELADRKGMDTADLVKDTLDSVLGAEIEPLRLAIAHAKPQCL
jgi:hypothetical protein